MFYQDEIVACAQADSACGFDLKHPCFKSAEAAAAAVLALPESWELNTTTNKYELTAASYDASLEAAKAVVVVAALEAAQGAK